MLKTNKEFRAISCEALKGNWTPVVLATLIYCAIVGASSFTFLFSIPISIFLVAPIGMSFVILYVKFLRGEKENAISNLFTCFKDYGKFLGTSLLVVVFTFLWTLLLIIPGIIKSYAYSMTFFIVHDDSAIGSNDAIELSMKMMKGNKMKLFLLDLSFIGWYLLGLLSLGIGYLWIIPYHYTARAAFYENLKETYTNVEVSQ